ncbi:hypothetical protein PMAYCL1PPCAC_15006, partial [Pristionchus mayeri]
MRLNKTQYVALHLLMIFTFPSYPPYLIVAYYKPELVACSIPSAFQGQAQIKWSKAMITVNVLTIIPYALTALIIRSRKTSSFSRRLFRSLLLVMIFDVGSWLAAVSFIKLL